MSVVLPSISEEQKRAVDNLKKGMNVSIQACAGSGKTTTAIHIALANIDKRILLLTYNARLKAETRQRARSAGCDNMEVNSYHSFAVRHGWTSAFTDTSLLMHLDSGRPFSCTEHYDIIIIDEAQDMSPLYHRLVLRIIRDVCKNPMIVVMGDRHQSIYDFNRADPRFLTMAHDIFPSDRPWTNVSLTTTYRLTHQMTRFIGSACKGAPSMKAVKNGPPVEYIVANNYSKAIQRKILGMVRSGKPSDIFVLAPSIRTATSPIRMLANHITKAGVPVYVPASDEERLDNDVVRGKVVFSTFHQIKGLERRVVVVFGFDQSYHDYYAKGLAVHTLPNTLFVAITRATHRLIIIHDSKKGFLPSIIPDMVKETSSMECPASFEPVNNDNPQSQPSLLREKRVCVSDLIRYLPVDIVASCEALVRAYPNKDDGLGIISVPVKTTQKNNLCEAVSEITGTCMPALFESKRTGRVSFLEKTPDLCARFVEGDSSVMPSILKHATAWCGKKSGFCFKEIQITKYDWLTMDHMEAACRRLEKIIPTDTEPRFEERLEATHKGYRIHGFADVITSDGMLFELKAVSQLSSEHLIQLALYLWLCSRAHGIPPIRRAVLINLIDGAMIEIHPTPYDLDAMVSILLDHKMESSRRSMDDHQFIRMCIENNR